MTILTVDEFREHVETTLGDDALQRLLDAAEAEIVRYAGAAGSRAELVDGGYGKLALSRPAGSIASVVELVGTTSTTLATNDYRIRADGYVLERLSSGTNGSWRWRGLVTVTYEPADDEAIRIGVQLDLVRLGLNTEPGVTQETIGAWSETVGQSKDWTTEDQRASILSRLNPEPGMFVVPGARR